MKLQLKHLAPYLPYDLRIARFTSDDVYKRVEYSLRGTNINEVLRYNNLKPILKPLSDITKEIEYKGERFVPFIKLGLNENNKEITNIGQYYFPNAVGLEDILWITEKLFEWHFDVFGLIPAGLAIDLNTVK